MNQQLLSRNLEPCVAKISKLLSIRPVATLPFLLLAFWGHQSAIANDFNWGKSCKIDSSGNGQPDKTIAVQGKLLGDKQSVVFNADQVSALVNNDSGEPQQVTLVTYKEYYKHWNFDDIYENATLVKLGQTVFDFETQTIPPGETLLTVDMPGCATQVDLVCGPVHEYLGDGNLYGSRKLAWYHAHEKINNQEVWCDDGIDTPVEQPCQLSIAEVTGISEVLVYDNSHSSACDRISVPFELRQPTDQLLDDEEPLLATLLDFAARAHQQSILLEWTTAVEINNVGFCLWRAYKDHKGEYRVNGRLLATKASDFKGASYAYRDKAVASGITYYYGLESISFGHSHECTPQMTTLEALRNKEFLSIDSAIIGE